MRHIRLGFLGLALAAGLLAATPRAESQQACTLLCIQGYHCCVSHGTQSCIPESTPCRG